MEQWIKLGKEAGFAGQELVQFVERKEKELAEINAQKERELAEINAKKEQEITERNERAAEREMKKLEIEERRKEREEEIRRKEKEKQMEIEMEKIAAEERKQKLLFQEQERKREDEERKRAHELELARLRADQGELIGRIDNYGGAKRPRLPAFMDGKDDLDSYLERFERFAKTSKWPEAEWATNLSALLSGRALEIYSRMSEEEAVVYQKVKQALLRGYDFTEQGFQQRFRSSKPERGESPQQFLVRIQNYLSRWVELAGQEEDYEGLSYLIIKEQFLDSCPKDLAVYLHRQENQSLASLAEAALRYLQTQNRKFSVNPMFQSTSADESTTPQDNGETQLPLTCFNCGKQGHKAKSCSVQMVPDRGHSNRRGIEDSRNQRRYNSSKNGTTASVALQSNQHETIMNRNQPLHHFPETDELVVTCAFTSSKPEKVPATVGTVCQKEASVLRDTGCDGVVVKKDFVNNHQFTGQSGSVRCIHGHVEKVPKAEIEVSTPYFTGTVSALCLPNPPRDLIIGNIEGARAAGDPDPDWTHDSGNTKSDQTKKEKSAVPVSVNEQCRRQNLKTTGVNGSRPVHQRLGGNYDNFKCGTRRGDRLRCINNRDCSCDQGGDRWRVGVYGGRCDSCGGSQYGRRRCHGSGSVSHKFTGPFPECTPRRPRLKLLPRMVPTPLNVPAETSRNSNIFGTGRPHDENTWASRRSATPPRRSAWWSR